MEFFTIAFSVLAIGGAIGLVFFKHPLHGAMSFLVTLLSVAGFYALLSNKFLFILQIIIYAGAIMVLIMFVIMFLNVREKELIDENFLVNKFILGALLLAPFAYLLFSSVTNYTPQNIPLAEGFGTIQSIGLNLFTEWMFTFELISILLLGAVVGAVVVAQKESKNG